MDIKRDKYLNDLINRMHNGMIKVVTGIRRCGKSYLLFNIFKNYLLEHGVAASHIITIELDQRKNKKYRDPDTILDYIESLIEDDEQYYIMLDEVQMLQEFEEVLNSLLHIRNADIYVTGSNSKFLSKDVITEFRGRGDEIHIYPLTFKEFMEAYDGDMYRGWAEYVVYGGLPLTVTMKDADSSIKGIGLQKIRAAERLLRALLENKRAVFCTIEHVDDVLEVDVEQETTNYTAEQNKSYSTDFSMNSHEVKNSLRIFFDNWYGTVEASESIRFVFYTNTNIKKENKVGVLKDIEEAK